jgi:hypothetical protein
MMDLCRLWQEVTKSLETKDIHAATHHKKEIEHKQRLVRRHREQHHLPWQSLHFDKQEDGSFLFKHIRYANFILCVYIFFYKK